MSKILFLSLLVLISACSKSKSKKKKPPQRDVLTYVGKYTYPVNDLLVGEGVRTVPAIGIIECTDNHGVAVDFSLCDSPADAEPETQSSPAGIINVPVVGADGGSVDIIIAEGENVSTLPQVIVDARIESVLTCEASYVKVAHQCKIPGHELVFSSYTTPTRVNICDGTEILTRSIIDCVDNITMTSVNASNCSALTDPTPSITHQSPAGTKNIVNGGNTEIYTCALGELGGTQTDIICGNTDEHKAGLSCVADVFTPTSFSFPASTKSATCSGTETVNATAITACSNDSKGISVAVSKCVMPSTIPTQTYQSPAGTRNVVNGSNTEVYTCLLGELNGTQTDITCGDPDQHKSGLTCVADVFTPTAFSFPASTKTAICSGTEVVNASAITACHNDSKGISVAVSKCVMPSTIPTETHESPAGTRNVVNGSNTEVYTCATGELNGTQTDIICGNADEHKSGLACVADVFTPTAFSFPASTKTAVCSGTEVVNATAITACSNDSKGTSAAVSKCSMPTTIPTETHQSPAGTNNVVNGVNTEVYTCALGEAGGTQTDIICGSAIHHKVGLTCVADTLAPTYSYPANTAVACDGPLTVDASAVTDCYNSTKSESVALLNCPMPSTKPTQTYQSPAGTKNVVNGANTEIYTCAIDEVGGTITDIICGTLYEHKVGTICVPDTFIASGFTYPANSLAVGYGSQVVSPTGFTTCTNQWDNSVVANSNCSIPVGAPTVTHLSPAGDVDLTVANAVNGKVTLSLAEGQDFYGQSLAVREAAFASALVCLDHYLKDGLLCRNVVRNLSYVFGQSHKCVIMSNGDTRCWGNNSQGFGDDSTANYLSASNISAFANAKFISAGSQTTCAVFEDSSVKCAGDNSVGQFGDGTTVSSPVAKVVTQWQGAKTIHVGGQITCAVFEDSSVKCAGKNDLYQLGDGTTVDRPTPVTISGFNGVKQLVVSMSQVCGIMSDDTVKCGGVNAGGQFGNGNATTLQTPATISAWGTAKRITIFQGTTCVIGMNDVLRCAGQNSTGQLGDGTTVAKSVPTSPTGITTVRDISVSTSVCAVLMDKTVKCWGRNHVGQLGNGASVAIQSSPVVISGLTNMEKVFVPNNTSCFMSEARVIKCAGGNTGDGTASVRNTPVLVDNAQPD